MASKIQVRRDTLSNWNANNPVLSAGEIAFVSDENRIKIGNGSTAFTSLSYATGVSALSGTANEIDISASTGSITISLPSTINANTTGSAATLTTSRTIEISGDVSGSATFDGSANINISAQIQPNSVALGTDTTGNYIASASAGNGINITGSGSETAAITISNTGVTSLSGTGNQISVSASNGDATLSLPSSVIFPGTVTLNANPTQALHAATKQYVDAVAEGLHIHASVETATTASVDLNSAPSTIDGITLTDGMRVLVKNQSTTADNGIYTYSASADALIRATDFDSSSEIQGGDFLFVTGGNTYDNTGWVQTEKVTTVGTDPILFTQFSGAGTYTAGTGLQLDGTVFSNTGVLSLTGTTNEIDVSASTGSIIISLPSSINANTTGSAATLTTSRTIELSGDVSGSATFDGSANASITSTLANTAVTPNTYGSASAVGIFTVDSKGRLTSASNSAIAIAQSAVTNLTTDLAAKASLASPALTGTPTAPTAAYDDDSTQIATTAFVQDSIERITINTVTASAYTLALGDAGEVVEMNVSSANTVTVPLNSTIAFPIGSTIDIIQYGSGSTTIVAESGVTIRSKGANLKLTSQYSGATLYKRGTDEWVIVGDLTT